MPTASRCSMISSTIVLEVALPAGQGRELVLQARWPPWRRTPGAREDLLVAVGPGADLLDVAFGRRMSRSRSLARVSTSTSSSFAARTAGLGLGQLGVLGQGPPAVRELVELGVERLRRRAGAAGRRGRLSVGSPPDRLCAADGPRIRAGVDTRISTVPPSAARRTQPPAVGQPGPLAAQWRDVDQRRAAVLEGLRRRVVAQVGGDVGVHAGRGAPRRAGRRPLPRTPRPADRPVRVAGDPHAPAWSAAAAAATRSAKVAQRLRLGPGADPAEPARRRQVGQLEHVERRLLVGVRGAQGGDDRGPPVRAAAPSRAASRPPAPAAPPGRSSGARPASGVNGPVPAEVNAHWL